MVEDSDVANRQTVTVTIMLHPTAGVSQANTFNQDVTTVFKVNILGPGTTFVFEISPLAINNTTSPDCNMPKVLSGKDGPVAEFLVLGIPKRARRPIITFIFAAKERTAGIEPDSDVAFEIDRTGEPGASGEVNCPTPISSAFVDRALDSSRAQGLTIGFSAEIPDVIYILCSQTQ
jgi:hypothetical protein